MSDAFVLDASITATWLLPDEHTAASQALFARLRGGVLDVHVPDIWLAECGNIIASTVKRKRAAAADATVLWAVLDSVRQRVERFDLDAAQWRTALLLAVERRLSLYDASYLWLASSLQLPLCTDDEQLGRAAIALGVPVLTVNRKEPS